MAFDGHQPKLASRFSYRGLRKTQQNRPLTDDEIRAVAPSIFALDKHVKSIDGNIALNRALWRLAEEMRALKSA